jgi:hypothetical protein
MKSKRSRLALVGVLALTLSVTVGLLSGSVADAKKKKAKKGGTVTASVTGPTTLPPRADLGGGHFVASKVVVPIVVGKKAKNKVVSADSVKFTYSASGPAPQLGNGLDVYITNPLGRPAFIPTPFDDTITAFGPLTADPNSATGTCEPSPTPPPPPCADPDNSLGPPYAGTVGDQALANYTGTRAKGTWSAVFKNFSDQTLTIGPKVLSIGLQSAPLA